MSRVADGVCNYVFSVSFASQGFWIHEEKKSFILLNFVETAFMIKTESSIFQMFLQTYI